MRTSNGRRTVSILAGAALSAALLVPAGAAYAEYSDADSETKTMTLVVEIPERTASPTASPTLTTDPTPWPQPSSTSTAAPGNGASGQLPATGGENLLWLLAAGGAVTAIGLTIRGAARARQSRTAPRS